MLENSIQSNRATLVCRQVKCKASFSSGSSYRHYCDYSATTVLYPCVFTPSAVSEIICGAPTTLAVKAGLLKDGHRIFNVRKCSQCELCTQRRDESAQVLIRNNWRKNNNNSDSSSPCLDRDPNPWLPIPLDHQHSAGEPLSYVRPLSVLHIVTDPSTLKPSTNLSRNPPSLSSNHLSFFFFFPIAADQI